MRGESDGDSTHAGARTSWSRVPGLVRKRLDGVALAVDALLPVLLVILFAVAVLLVPTFVPWGQNADDLLPALISTQKLTFYFWGQDRFANLLPALTMWIGAPARNAEGQVVLRIVTGLVAPAFFAHCSTPGPCTFGARPSPPIA